MLAIFLAKIERLNLAFLDILFPIRCISCGQEGSWLCQVCSAQIKIQTEHVCGVCEKVFTPDGRTCLACKKKSALDGLLPVTEYSQASRRARFSFCKLDKCV